MAAVKGMISSTETSQTPPAKDAEAQETVESTTNVAEPVPPPVLEHSPSNSQNSQMTCGENYMVESEMSLPLVALEERNGSALALFEAKVRKEDEGDSSLPRRQADRFSSDAIFQDNQVLPSAAPLPDGGEHPHRASQCYHRVNDFVLLLPCSYGLRCSGFAYRCGGPGPSFLLCSGAMATWEGPVF